MNEVFKCNQCAIKILYMNIALYICIYITLIFILIFEQEIIILVVMYNTNFLMYYDVW